MAASIFSILVCIFSAGLALPGGVSQVGFSIYRDRNDYYRQKAANTGAYTQGQNGKVLVTYAVSHPGGQGGYSDQGADLSGTRYDLSGHFQNHGQHVKQFQNFRQGGQSQVVRTRPTSAPAVVPKYQRAPAAVYQYQQPSAPVSQYQQAPAAVYEYQQPSAPVSQYQQVPVAAPQYQQAPIAAPQYQQTPAVSNAAQQLAYVNPYLLGQQPMVQNIYQPTAPPARRFNPIDLMSVIPTKRTPQVQMKNAAKLYVAQDDPSQALNEALDDRYPVQYF